MDQSDKSLLNGLIVFVVLAGVAYFWPADWPVSGYGRQTELQDSARVQLEKDSAAYEKFYAPMHPTNFGKPSTEKIVAPSDVTLLDSLKNYFKQANLKTQQVLEEKQDINRTAFPEWTTIPKAKDNVNDGPSYFRDLWTKHKLEVQSKCHVSNVILDDNDIGFKTLGSVLPRLEKAKELLREMHIAEKIIELCIQAKNEQEAYERAAGKQPEAFMRIMQVDPKESEPTGPTSLRLNPRYDPGEKNPSSPAFKKYNVDILPSFIQEYPVQIALMCDTNSFIGFLHLVRTKPGQFMVIRQLEILSPAMFDSNCDVTEAKVFRPSKGEGAATKADEVPRWPTRPEQIVVTINAAGMDFFDPKDFPHGLYEAKAPKAAPTRSRRVIGISPGAAGAQ
jgi:hypothetical protein